MGVLLGAIPKQGDGIVADHAAFPALALEGKMRILDAATAPSGSETSDGAGAIPDATYTYEYTNCTRNPITDAILQESAPSSASTGVVVNGGPSKVALTGILAAASNAVNCRRIYREVGGGNYLLVGIIRDNITTTFTDNAASTTGQPQAPATNNSGAGAILDVPVGTHIVDGREEGTGRFKVDSKGILQLGAMNPAHPYGFGDVVEEISKKIGGVGAPTYTVQSGKILVISALHGPDSTGGAGVSFLVDQGAGAVTLAHTTTGKSGIDWILRNPILADAGDVVSSNIASSGTEFIVAGVEITRNGGIVPIILAAVVQGGGSEYTVPADKVFVLLGVGTLDTVSFGIKDGASGTPYPPVIEDESMVFDSGGDSLFENKITTPMVLPAGAAMGGTGIGCTIWGYEVDT